jgi:hypothetical protein
VTLKFVGRKKETKLKLKMLRILDRSFMFWSFELADSFKSRFRSTKFKFSKMKSALVFRLSTFNFAKFEPGQSKPTLK